MCKSQKGQVINSNLLVLTQLPNTDHDSLPPCGHEEAHITTKYPYSKVGGLGKSEVFCLKDRDLK